MQKYNFSELSLKTLKTLVDIQQKGISDYTWTDIEQVTISDNEQCQLDYVKKQLTNYPTNMMNEATLWARAIYPLLLLAEQGNILATAQAPLIAQYPKFTLHGIADGILGKCIAGNVELPYLVVLEAKRGLENTNPQPQVYGQLLATLRLNSEENNQIKQMFGCYVIAGSWTFVRAEITQIDSDYPMLKLEHSREYNELLEAATILKILKSIVAHYLKDD